MIRRRLRTIGSIVAVSVAIFLVLLSGGTSQALSGIWRYGYQTGYFDLQPADHDCYRWYGNPGLDCFVIPEGINVNTVSGFMTVITDNYYSGDYARMTGASYIVHSMLGQAQGTTSRNVTAAQFTDLQNRLNYVNSYGGITWSQYYSTNDDGGLDSKVDVYVANTFQDGQAIIFRNQSGTPIYVLFRLCANPDGDLPGNLPGLNFNLNPTVSGSPSVTQAGSQVQIQPSVNNAGTTQSSGVNWQLSTFTIPSGGAVPGGGTGGQSPNAHYGHGATTIKSGSGTFSRGATPVGQGPQQLPDLPVGTKICYALSVQPWNQNTTDWRYSTPFCVIISEAPLVQVLGGDVSAGHAYPGETAPASSKVATSLTTKTTTVTVPRNADVPMTNAEIANDFTGLWNTGVNASGNKIAANEPDPHWSIDGVLPGVASDGTAIAKTCQKAYYNGTTLSGYLPSTGATAADGGPIPATTILEGEGKAGHYPPLTPSVIAQVGGTQSYPQDNSYIWSNTNPAARWIGINQYGLDYSTNGCNDPSQPTGSSINVANTYVFTLKDGFNIDTSTDNIDLNSVRLKLTGSIDNGAIFVVNGKVIDGAGGTSSAGAFTSKYADASGTVHSQTWLESGWGGGTNYIESPSINGVFKAGHNTLSVYVKSTYSLTGLMIHQFTVEANKITSVSTPTTLTAIFGSWGQYGINATGTITGMASGAALRNINEVGSTTSCSRAPLTFSNAPTGKTSCQDAGPMGNYSNTRQLPDIQNDFTGSAAGTLSGISSLSSANGIYDVSGDITINPSTISRGHSVIIRAPHSTVTIAGDIKYNAPGMTYTSIPQVVIMAGAINIEGKVQHIDAWLIAKSGGGLDGRIVTCSDYLVTDPLTSTRCDKQLTVHGPVVAEHLYLRRTYGAGTGDDSGTPAEIFDFRPDAYIWALQWQQAHIQDQIQTISSAEVPPRF